MKRELLILLAVGLGCGGNNKSAPDPAPAPPPTPPPTSNADSEREALEPRSSTKPALDPQPVPEVLPREDDEPPLPTVELPASGTSTARRDDNVSKRPVLINHSRPDYPEAAKKKGIEGNVVVELHVSAQGAVTRVGIVSSEHTELNTAATKAALKLRFRPARDKADQPIATTVRFTFRFAIK